MASVPSLAVVDSLITAAFTEDSLGSITVGVIAGPSLAWTRSVGFADMQRRRLADRGTVYRTGSITKPFTALMLLQLAHAGRVRLSDPVQTYLPEVREIRARPAGASPVTFLQLATMTAGLAREPDDAAPFWSGPVSSWEQTLRAALPRVRYAGIPGTEYVYSNVGYAILGAALGRAAGVPYAEWMRTRVFLPLGMQRTRLAPDPSITPDVAVGYSVDDNGAVDDTTAAREARRGRGYRVPNGAMFTTVDDLARFVSFALGHGPEDVLPTSVLDDTFGGLVATNASLTLGYGVGFMARTRDGYPVLGHSGGVTGYEAAMYFDRNAQLGVVVLHNVSGGKTDADGLALEILATLTATHRAALQADIDRRVRTQVASPHSAAALRRVIDELRRGRPNYRRMSPELARQMRRRLADERTVLKPLGALESLAFTGVGAAGPDIYRATFAQGTWEWRIWMSVEGRVDYVTHRAVPTSP